MKISCDYLVVGAGIVGLTIAWELKNRYPLSRIIILEKEADIGFHASGRNSGVLHSGIYYGNDTLKAKVCSKGSQRMKDFATEYNIPCEENGKIIIATSDKDIPVLNTLLDNAKNNGVEAYLLDEKEILKMEPYSSPYQAGIYSPGTSVIDSKSVLSTLKALLEEKNVHFYFSSALLSVSLDEKVVRTHNNNFSFGYLYNCAGAYSDQIAKKFGLAKHLTLVPFKGIYYKLKRDKEYLVKSSIYPTPDYNLPFLGVHLTKVINGDIYVGPTAIPAFGRENYGILSGIKASEGIEITSNLVKMYIKNKQNFRKLAHSELKKYIKSYLVADARALVGSLKSDDLISSQKVGIRPQLINSKTNKLEMDYIIQHNECSTHVLNSISPAFTSSFEFARIIVHKSKQIG